MLGEIVDDEDLRFVYRCTDRGNADFCNIRFPQGNKTLIKYTIDDVDDICEQASEICDASINGKLSKWSAPWQSQYESSSYNDNLIDEETEKVNILKSYYWTECVRLDRYDDEACLTKELSNKNSFE